MSSTASQNISDYILQRSSELRSGSLAMAQLRLVSVERPAGWFGAHYHSHGYSYGHGHGIVVIYLFCGNKHNITASIFCCISITYDIANYYGTRNKR
jgi:hypothetical protein